MADEQVGNQDEEEEDKEKWVKHYSSNHQILLVGEGDFSFALSLASSFGSASNIVASSLDTLDDLIKKYKNAKSNLEDLKKLGTCPLHGVDATQMELHPVLKMLKFDRIIFNFPHAGFHGKEDNVKVIEKHMDLVRGFFKNARGMLRAYGEIHVNHKTTPPFCNWNIEELALINSLVLIECVDFNIEEYPGYNNKRGDSMRCDEPFPLGECSTFKFRFSSADEKMSKATSHLCSAGKRPQQLPENLIRMHQPSLLSHILPQATTSNHRDPPPTFSLYKEPQPTLFNQARHQPTLFDHMHPQTHLTTNMGGFPGYMHSPSSIDVRKETANVFDGYHNPALEAHGRAANHADYSCNDVWKYEHKIFNPSYMQSPSDVLDGHHNLAAHGRAANHADYSCSDSWRHDQKIYNSAMEANGRAPNHVDYSYNDMWRQEHKIYNPAMEAHSRAPNNVDCSYMDLWRHDHEIYMPENPGRTSEGDWYVRQEDQHMNRVLWRSLVLNHG